MIELVVICVEGADGGDVGLFARRRGANLLRFLNCAFTLFHLRRAGRCPERMKVAHGDAPIGHAAAWIDVDYLGKRFFSLFILERMKPGDRAIELFLRLRITGNSEIDSP